MALGIKTTTNITKSFQENAFQKTKKSNMAFQQISLREFGQKIKNKYPAYNDMDDVDLAQRFIAKNPQYQKTIISTDVKTDITPVLAPEQGESLITKLKRGFKAYEKGVEEFGLGQAKGLFKTLTGLAKLAVNVGEKIGILSPERAEAARGEAARIQEKVRPETGLEVAGFVTEQLIESVIASKALPGTPAVFKGPGLVKTGGRIAFEATKGGLLSGVFGAFNSFAEGNNPEEIKEDAIEAANTGAAWSAAIQTGLESWQLLSVGLKKLGTKIQLGSIRPSQKDLKDGFDVDNIRKYNLKGDLQDVIQGSDDQIDDLNRSLKNKLIAGQNIDLEEAYIKTGDKLNQQTRFKFGQNKAIDNAYKQLESEINIAKQALGATDDVLLTKANDIKRASGRMGAWEFGKPDLDSTARETVYDTFYNTLKVMIEEASGQADETAAINKQMGELIALNNAAVRRLPIEMRTRPLGLTESLAFILGENKGSILSKVLVFMAQKSLRVGTMSVGAAEKMLRGIEGVPKDMIPALAVIISNPVEQK